ncbi:MAG: tetratricopeptide repeat protein [Desulfatiglandaceae bacterium]|jgi:predicted negative regulator of RcsB-dependent stress response
MAKKKITRKQLLKEPDEFLTFSAKAINYFAAHLKQLKYLGIAVGVLLIICLGGYTYYRHMNNKGQEVYNTAYEALAKALKPDMKPGDLKKPGELFQKVIDGYGLSKAARLALPEKAYIQFLQGDYDGAITLYRQFLDKVAGNDQYESLARMALAACYEQKGAYQTAIVSLKPILTETGNPFRGSAMLSMARLYGLNKQAKEKQETLKEFIEIYKNSPFLPMAKAML